MNSNDPVLVEHHDSFTLITINREAKLNALNPATIQDLTRILTELQNDSNVRVVILNGAGERAFSAGADIEELSALTPDEASDFARAGQALTNLIEDLGKPVIGAINGLAYGGGCELATACAWRIATANAKFGQPEAKIGLSPGFGGTARLSKLIGKSKVLEMILTGDPITADEALRISLINYIARDRDDLMTRCEEIAQQISRNAPLAIKYALEAVNHGAEIAMAKGLRLESALFGLCFATEDVKEGTQAFLEKRHPIFKGK